MNLSKFITISLITGVAQAYAGGESTYPHGGGLTSRTGGNGFGPNSGGGTYGLKGGETIGPKSAGGYGNGRSVGAGTGPGGVASGLRGGAAGSRVINDRLGGADGSNPMGCCGTGN